MNSVVALGEWLHRRYGRGENWPLMGGREKGRWFNDAQSALDWLSKKNDTTTEAPDTVESET